MHGSDDGRAVGIAQAKQHGGNVVGQSGIGQPHTAS